MAVYKGDKKDTWYVKFRHRDWKNEVKCVTKRGFKTKRDATQWERDYRTKLEDVGDSQMTFAQFVEVYKEDLHPRLKESTRLTKEHIIDTKIVPYFGHKLLCDIQAVDVIQWQNMFLKKNMYTPSYLKTIHNQLSAIFNHGVRYYSLPNNPARIVGNMGGTGDEEMKFWTKEQYLQFSEAMMDTPMAYYAFQILYWCGIREGELLALTRDDIDLERKQLSITKTYQRIKGRDVVTSPKTPNSRRVVQMPTFLCGELEEYFALCYDLQGKDRVFPVTKGYLIGKIHTGADDAGLPHIRVHDLRHSHVSLLIHMGYHAVAIAQRVGHKSIDITYRYAHLFPSVQADIAFQLDQEGGDC